MRERLAADSSIIRENGSRGMATLGDLGRTAAHKGNLQAE
jgi:hypothetical protein